ncbi:MAG: ribose-5-phosphate isomerase RpiA [Methanobacteriota archaeon]
MAVEDQKRRAAEASLKSIRAGMVVGLGTGSTARYVLEGIARLVADGVDVRGVPTSLATADLAKSLGIPLTSLEENPRLDVAIDGADEVDPKLNLIKGLGGALFRERIVARAAKKFVVVVDESKLVPRLGTHAPLPVEVHPFGWRVAVRALEQLGATVELRRTRGEFARTDNGNYLAEARFGAIKAPGELAIDIQAIPGVVGHGLFLGMADLVLVGTEHKVRAQRPTRRT